MNGTAVIVGVAVLVLLRWIYWMVFQLTGDTRKVSFGWRIWLAFFVAMAIMMPMGPLLQRLEDFAHEVGYFDGAILIYVVYAGWFGIACLAGTVVYFLGERSIPFGFCWVFCSLAWYAANVVTFVNGNG